MSAESACRLLGTNWSVTKVYDGSLVCSSVEWTKNCNKCDTWRLFVWVDGAVDNYKTSISPCHKNNTLAGYYYCGHIPCNNCSELAHGGRWVKDEQR